MPGNRKARIGRVISTKMDKTIVVAIEWRQRHPIYKKAVRRITRFKAHDENKLCHMGDLIRIVETRPLSRTKRWRVDTILTKGKVVEVTPQQIEAPLEEVLHPHATVQAQASAPEAAPSSAAGATDAPSTPQEESQQ